VSLTLTILVKYIFSISLSFFHYVCYFSQVTLLLLRPHKCQSNITQLLFQIQNPTSHTHITLLPFASLLYPNSTSKHIIRNQYFTVCSIHFSLLLPLQSSVSANPVAAQFVTPITFWNILLWDLSKFFHASLNPHTSIPCLIFASHTISYTFPYICTFTLRVTDIHLSVGITALYTSVLGRVFPLFQTPVLSNVTPRKLNLSSTLVLCQFILHLSVVFNYPPFLNAIILDLLKLHFKFQFFTILFY